MFTEEGDTHIIVIKKLQCEGISSFREKTNDTLREWLRSKLFTDEWQGECPRSSKGTCMIVTESGVLSALLSELDLSSFLPHTEYVY